MSPVASLLYHSPIHVTCDMQMDILCSVYIYFDLLHIYGYLSVFILGHPGTSLLNSYLIHVT